MGRGLAILYKEKFKVSQLTLPAYSSFESVALKINWTISTILTTIYRTLMCLAKSDFSTVDELVSYYNDGLNMISDDFAPVQLFHLYIQLLGLHLNCMNLKLKGVG